MEVIDSFFNFIIEYREYCYLTVFAILIASGFGLPISKDGFMIASGIVAGVLGESDPNALYVMLVVCIVGVILGDSVMFLGGRLLSFKIQKIWPFSRFLTPKIFARLRKDFKKFNIGLIFIARFTPLIRAPLYIFCGLTRKISYLKFVIVNTTATTIYACIWIGLGYIFTNERHKIAQIASQINQTVVVAIIFLVILTLTTLWIKKRYYNKNHKKNADRTTSASR